MEKITVRTFSSFSLYQIVLRQTNQEVKWAGKVAHMKVVYKINLSLETWSEGTIERTRSKWDNIKMDHNFHSWCMSYIHIRDSWTRVREDYHTGFSEKNIYKFIIFINLIHVLLIFQEWKPCGCYQRSIVSRPYDVPCICIYMLYCIIYSLFLVYLTKLLIVQVISEQWIWKELVMAHFEVLFYAICQEGLRETTKEPVRIAGIKVKFESKISRIWNGSAIHRTIILF